MDLQKILNSRKTIIDIYKNYGYDTSSIPNLSIKELKIMLNEYKPLDTNISTFGDGFAFNFKLQSSIIDNHNLHIIYYNFNDSSKKISKINKSIVDKIIELYNIEYLNDDDSLLLIINDRINDTVTKLNYSLTMKLLKNYNISPDIEKQIKEKDYKLSKEYLKNSTFLNIDTLQYNVLEHKYVPKHIHIYNNKEIDKILKENNVKLNQLPVISKNDIISKLIRLVPGSICKILRETEKGVNIYYRICK
jgi:DNA-directed RNA polymerase subunit H (RpoH/RPB5)